MKKTYKKLTEEQINRGVIFSSLLVGSNNIQEVLNTDTDKDDKIKRLLDDSFFNKSPYSHNEIRQ